MIDQNNLVVLRGAVTHEPTCRDIATGTVASFDLASVPIALHDPSQKVLDSITTGAELVVIGSVRRRFFRTGGATLSRTEVVAERVITERRIKTARQAIIDATDAVRRGDARPGRSTASE